VDVSWPPQSPDFPLSAFLLWRCLKEKVLFHRPQDIEELRPQFARGFAKLLKKILRGFMDSFNNRMPLFIENRSANLMETIFKN
jgi:hypothetical protein